MKMDMHVLQCDSVDFGVSHDEPRGTTCICDKMHTQTCQTHPEDY